MPGPTAADLIFSEQANHNFSRTLGDLKRSTLSIGNRLRSIQHDATFAQQVADVYNRPLIANERCGSWYIDPKHKGGSAYFKSTDGHTGVWKFSTRRLNLHLLDIIGKHDGCIIVDSTRRGKRMPDALSKTIPIWCGVLNRLLFPDTSRFHDLHSPPQIVSHSEHAQISALLPSFMASFQDLNLPIESLKSKVAKPLRPIWVTPESDLFASPSIFEDFHPIVCCTVSRRVLGTELSEGGYIQGAGDDTENWAHGLTAPIFWAHRADLLSTPEADLSNLIEDLVGKSTSVRSTGTLQCLKPTSCLFISPLDGIQEADGTAIVISLLPEVTDETKWRISATRLEVGLGPHKIGSRNLRTSLPLIVSFVVECLASLQKQSLEDVRIIVECENGKDLSIGVALTLLCLFFSEEGALFKEVDKQKIDKNFIRRRLGWISSTIPDVNPSRMTLQSVNSFLIERP